MMSSSILEIIQSSKAIWMKRSVTPKNRDLILTGILNSYGGVYTDDKWFMHMTLQYLCCYGLSTYVEMVEALSTYQWKPFSLRFAKVICNYGGVGFGSNSIIVLLDDESQNEMLDFVEQIEKYLENQGFVIHRKRKDQEHFHSTLGTVSSDYPMEKALAQVNEIVPIFNNKPMIISSFFIPFPPYVFHANSTT
eukprot:TRINITY_DN2466_c0_g1_i1.p1 TRINITY_DN2466_c0_g1~~TRINITY_DN2466_c0_g1_i1.p1  ORF type:complete len:193 (+),score=2.69 TRINITY_DN2466_c0_g1_i1:171-749(+)